jgi:hypothetical protein
MLGLIFDDSKELRCETVASLQIYDATRSCGAHVRKLLDLRSSSLKELVIDEEFQLRVGPSQGV